MAKYIKQEMVDLNGKGEVKAYYRMKTNRNIDFRELAMHVQQHHSIMNRGLVENVMSTVVDSLAELLGEGYSVTIDGLGTFKASLGLKRDKEMDTFDGEDSKRNARSLQLTGINFKVDKALVREANSYCKLEREGESRLHHSPFTREERLALAQEYLNQNGAMKVKNYMELTGLSHTKAILELKQFRQDASTRITTIGRRSTLVYVKRNEDEES